MSRIDTHYWNDKHTHLPGWFWMLNMPRAAESPAFVEGILKAAALRRGLADGELSALAAAALADASGEEGRPAAAPDTVKFAMLVADALYIAVTTAHYLTDAFDKNTPGSRWRPSQMMPVEQMVASIRESRADDCEGYAAGVASLMYGIVHGDAAAGGPLYAAVHAILCCWVPVVALGQAERSLASESDENMKQYNTGDHMNAHSWLRVLYTGAASSAMARHRGEAAEALAVDYSKMWKPWVLGIPTVIIDCTGRGEHYPRSWAKYHAEGGLSRRMREDHPFVLVPDAMDPNYHCVCRGGYTPYGVISAENPASRVFEVYWYTGKSYAAASHDLFRMPHVKPPGAPRGPPPPSRFNPGAQQIWLAARNSVSWEQLATLRPAVALMHPVRPAPADPDVSGGARGAELVQIALEALRFHGIHATHARPPPRKNPWAVPVTMAIRYAEAADRANMRIVAKTLKEFHRRVYVHSLSFWEGEPQLWITPAAPDGDD